MVVLYDRIKKKKYLVSLEFGNLRLTKLLELIKIILTLLIKNIYVKNDI